VHLAELPADLEGWLDDALVDRWTRLIAVRDAVNTALEGQRQAKAIGTALEAKVVLEAGGDTLALLRENAAQLPMLFIVSETDVVAAGAGAPELTVRVLRSDGTKCLRCWRYVHDISTEPAFAGLCGRCVDAVAELV
jgi:isoleucyl-tRNA synthetase